MNAIKKKHKNLNRKSTLDKTYITYNDYPYQSITALESASMEKFRQTKLLN